MLVSINYWPTVAIYALTFIFMTIPSCMKKQKIPGHEQTISVTGDKKFKVNPLKIPKDALKTSGPPHIVMVIDTGFDLKNEVLRDKIVASYTLNCADPKIIPPDSSSFEDKKSRKIKMILQADQDCSITAGIELNKDPQFYNVSTYKDKWNEAIKKKTLSAALTLLPETDVSTLVDLTGISLPELSKIRVLVQGSSGKYVYHGTSTAGLIAYQNPQAKLVLVQIKLGSGQITQSQGKELCPTQAQIDEEAKIYQDPDYQKAYISFPLTSQEKILEETMQKHGITITNMSFGKKTREFREKIFSEAGCGKLDFKALEKTINELVRKREKQLTATGSYTFTKVLHITSAGNDGSRIDSLEDHDKCVDDEDNIIVVGSYNSELNVSKFSNHGKCVTLYAPGEDIVTAVPENFLSWGSGTSFSSPLLARYVTQKFQTTLTPQQMKATLKKGLNKDGLVTLMNFPSELFFRLSKSIPTYALGRQFEEKSFIVPSLYPAKDTLFPLSP